VVVVSSAPRIRREQRDFVDRDRVERAIGKANREYRE